MNTNKRHHYAITILLLLGAFSAARLCFWLLPELFETWDAKAIDRLFLFRSSTPRFQVAYDDTIVHVDITDSTLKRLETPYLDRSHYARVIRNLSKMRVSAQMYDFIFAAPSDPAQDEALIHATKNAANVYFGMAFELKQEGNDKGKRDRSEGASYLDKTAWNVTVDGNPHLIYRGVDPLMTFPKLAAASRGLGFLNLNTDPDGVNRRMPLLVRYKATYYPSFSFRVICDYLRVPPEEILVTPGISIALKNARRPAASSGHDIIIPIDQHGNMLINFIGPWVE
ncbi:MAG: CHASE2 domain-containing protein [Deltaproteobacteria bacterium]|nr:CHASE2 domain-containing protein [Deltaproteobacteria bacterium]